MKKRRGKVLAAVLSLCLLLSGCARYSTEITDLIVPPEISGDLAEIRGALIQAAGEDITLRYPKSGDYRSAFVVYDIDGDSENEVFAFYSTVSDDNITVMHLNFIVKRQGIWQSVNDFSFESSGAEWIRFNDITGDQNPEVLISWAVSTSPMQKLTVFRFRTDELVSYLSEDYSAYTACSLDGNRDLLILKNDTVAKQARAKLFQLEPEGAVERGFCAADNGVVSYNTPIVAMLPDGTPAVYVDADKGTEGMITEAFYWRDGVLVNPFITEGQTANTATLRAAATACRDVNEDGIPEIPILTALPSPNETDAGDTVYLTDWVQWNGNGLTVCRSLLMNYTDNYEFSVDPDLRGKIAAQRNAVESERILYAYDAESHTPFTELFRIRAVSPETASVPETYQRLAESGNTVFMVLVRNNTLKIDLPYIKDHFSVLEQKES